MTGISTRAEDVLHYWFGDQTASDGVDDIRQKIWFVKNPAVDREIRERFGDLLDPARDGKLGWQDTSSGRLALILLLDQFSRNIFRGSAAAFAYDPAALQLCLEGLDLGADQSCGLFERVFCYLPLEHAESLECQERSIELFGALQAEAPAALQKTFASYLDYAVRHRDIIARFGRFPHRNDILGRASTPEEVAFLKLPGSSF